MSERLTPQAMHELGVVSRERFDSLARQLTEAEREIDHGSDVLVGLHERATQAEALAERYREALERIEALDGGYPDDYGEIARQALNTADSPESALKEGSKSSSGEALDTGGSEG